MRTVTAVVLAFVTASSARAQAINIDVHDAFGTPSSSFGAARCQPGVWNAVPPTLGTTPLVGLTGLATSATITSTGVAAPYSHDNPGTTGDDQALMDDLSNPSPGGATWTISGLAQGNYVLYTYGWAPDNPVFISSISVAGSSDPTQTVGGNWPGGYQLGVTHALHHVSVGAGGSIAMSITAAGGGSFGSLNGFQVVPDAGSPMVGNCCPGVGGTRPACGQPANRLEAANFGAGATSGGVWRFGRSVLSADTVVL
jgi:hypothetical protein